jgi:hypothetical protein
VPPPPLSRARVSSCGLQLFQAEIMQHLAMQHRPACGGQHAVVMQQSPWRCQHRPECSGQQWSCSHAVAMQHSY